MVATKNLFEGDLVFLKLAGDEKARKVVIDAVQNGDWEQYHLDDIEGFKTRMCSLVNDLLWIGLFSSACEIHGSDGNATFTLPFMPEMVDEIKQGMTNLHWKDTFGSDGKDVEEFQSTVMQRYLYHALEFGHFNIQFKVREHRFIHWISKLFKFN